MSEHADRHTPAIIVLLMILTLGLHAYGAFLARR